MIIVIRNDEAPKLKLDSDRTYEVAVIEMSFKTTIKQSNISLLSLQTNLIDVSTANRYQTIETIAVDARKLWYHSKKHLLCFHKLRLLNLEFVSFSVFDFFEDTPISIENFYIKLEIREINDRF